MLYNRENSWTKYRFSFFLVGLCISLTACLILINYTSYGSSIINYHVSEIAREEIITIPRTKQEKKKKLPPPEKIKAVKEILEEDIAEYVEDTLSNVKEDTLLVQEMEPGLPKYKTVSEPVKTVLPPKEDSEEVVLFAERMPVFGDCSQHEVEEKRQQCSKDALMRYIYSSLKYPKTALENGIEGTVVAQFVINKKGKVTRCKIVRDIGGGCGKAVEKMVANIPDWLPGKQGGRPVDVLYTMPVKFEIDR